MTNSSIILSEQNPLLRGFQRERIFDELTTGQYEYRRIGHDTRSMTFCPDGQIGIGRDRLEERWSLTFDNDTWRLTLLGENARTCELRREINGFWRGSWLIHEKMPIVIAPIIPRPVPNDASDIITDRQPKESSILLARGADSLLGDELIDLSNVSLCTATTVDHGAHLRALNRSLALARFANVVVFTDQSDWFSHIATTLSMTDVRSHEDFSIFFMTKMPRYREIFAEFVMWIQWDGFPVNPYAWTPQFLAYDFIGAHWDDGLVGNNGFCIMSRHYISCIDRLGLSPTAEDCYPSDVVTCKYERRGNRMRRADMEALGVRYAPKALAEIFSTEAKPYKGSFGFHGAQTLLELMQRGLVN